MQSLKYLEQIRSKDRQSQKTKRLNKDCDEYDWNDLVLNAKLKTLLVSELDKYLEKHKLGKTRRKYDKIRTISCHVMRHSDVNVEQDGTVEGVFMSDTDEDNDDEDEDIIVAHIGSSGESESEEEIDSDRELRDNGENFDSYAPNEPLPEYIVTSTRSGRRAGSWRNILDPYNFSR